MILSDPQEKLLVLKSPGLYANPQGRWELGMGWGLGCDAGDGCGPHLEAHGLMVLQCVVRPAAQILILANPLGFSKRAHQNAVGIMISLVVAGRGVRLVLGWTGLVNSMRSTRRARKR